jgi:conjugative relaxase-like TrwC/TraI family protein
MLSIAKINAASHQPAASPNRGGYLHYLGAPTTRQKGDFDDYARGKDGLDGPAPFWACRGPSLLGLDDIAEAEQVERLAKGFHPVTGAPLVKGAGDGHVMGLDMTFSAPKDFSAVFAGADRHTQALLIDCLQQSARAALGYAETAAVTRHGHGGRIKQVAEAAIACCYTHFTSRAVGDPQLHIHSFLFNVGKRHDSPEWSALEHRPQFERKMATGILFRAELAHRLKSLGFAVEAAGPYFTIRGIGDAQREALSTRSRQIADYMREHGMAGVGGAAEREVAALNTRSAKSEPPLRELISLFSERAAALGITPESVAAMRSTAPAIEEPFAVSHADILDTLMEQQSCATPQEALALICERAMGRWSAAECLADLGRFMEFDQVVQLGRTEQLTPVFTSKATLDLEARISQLVSDGEASKAHRVAPQAIDREFDRMESELRAKLGVQVSLGQQRKAALRIASDTGRHAFVEGWAGTGKTTMLKAAGAAFKSSGYSVIGCCQSAAASQNLRRETGIESRTIASLLLSLREGRAHLHAKSVVVLDEAGMVGSREFSILQEQAMAAGAKLVCVGDPKQLQPIGAGGIFGSLMRRHGKAEISNIQRQRTDFEPLLKWLSGKEGRLSKAKASALRELPEDARMAALEALCGQEERLSRAFERWRSRFDFEWMREAVEGFAVGEAKEALSLLDSKGRLKILSTQEHAFDSLIAAWSRDRTPLESKIIVAATRTEVAELNARARAALVGKGLIDDAAGADIEIVRRDETTAIKRFAPGDRIVFTMNDRELGVANGVAGTVRRIDAARASPILSVELDLPNDRGERTVAIPASFARFDLALCRTCHSLQGSTADSAHVLANPSMCDREWTYVAASRSRFSTTLYANASLLGLVDPESHAAGAGAAKTREAAVDALASRMRRSRAKGTSLDYDDAPDIDRHPQDARAPWAAAPGAKQMMGETIERIKAWSAKAAEAILAKRNGPPPRIAAMEIAPEMAQEMEREI